MPLAKPQNQQIHDILLILKGNYIPYGKDLGKRSLIRRQEIRRESQKQ